MYCICLIELGTISDCTPPSVGGEERTIEFLKRQGAASSNTPLSKDAFEKGVIKHPFPMNYILKPWKLGEWFYQIIKIGIVQYVSFYLKNVRSFCIMGKLIESNVVLRVQMIIKTTTAILAVFLEAFGVYCDGQFTWSCG